MTGDDVTQQRDELIYAGYVDYWEVKADLNQWRNISSWVNAPEGPCIPKGWYEDQKEFLIWIIGRIWPHRYLTFEKALLNYGLVLTDFINVFDKHLQYEPNRQDIMETQRFYNVEWNTERYEELAADYEAHVALVCDLFFELTRAANYVCDRVRETISPDYRMLEGALLIERHSVGYGLSTVRARLEYRGEERTELPYPGLDGFRSIRLTRDYAIAPDQLDR